MTRSEFCETLAQRFPDIAEILAEHMTDHDNVLLPHLFLADVTRYVLTDGRDRRPIVKFLDDAFESEGQEVEDLIAVSFVEYLVDPEELEKATKGLDAGHIRAEWCRQRET